MMSIFRAFLMTFVLNVAFWYGLPARAAEIGPTLAYFIGNSLTDNMNFQNVEGFADLRGKDYTWYRHTIPGSPLRGIWGNPEEGFTDNSQWKSIGGYDEALPNNPFTIVTAQPFNEHTLSELTYFNRFFDLALQGNPDVQMYVYQSWPTFDPSFPAWEEQWLFEDPRASANYGYRRCRKCFEVIADEATDAHRDAKPVLIVPGGSALYLLKQRIEAGEVPGLTQLQDIFSDNNHLTDAGRYLISITAYATFFKEDPHGLPTEGYGLDPSLALILQDIAWETVTTYPYTGVTAAPDVETPSVPQDLVANAFAGDQIDLSWSSSTDNVEVTGYKIYRNGTEIATTSQTTFSNTDLSPNTAYAYTISAFDAAGNESTQSNRITETTPGADKPTVMISADPAIVSSGSASTLSWTTTNADTCAASDGWGGAKDSSGTEVFSNISGNTTYKLTCTGPGGSNAQSATVIVDDELPNTPQNVNATANTPNDVGLFWDASSDNIDVIGYQVYRDGVEIATTSSTTYADIGLTQDTTYTYTVSAFDATGNESAKSANVIVTTPVPDKTPPQLTEVTPVQTPTGDHTPDYTFSTTEGGPVIVGGACDVANLYSLPAGTHTITFDYLPDGIYSDCTITMYDTDSNYSDPLPVSTFMIDGDGASIGMSLGPVKDYYGDKIFADLMKTSREWSGPVDEHGWPLGDSSVIVWNGLPGDKTGVYALSLTGSASVSTGGGSASVSNVNYDAQSNRTTANITVTGTGYLELRMTDTTGGVKDVKLMRPVTPGSSQSYDESVLFTDQIKSFLSKLSVVRLVNYNAANSNKQVNWSERVLPNDASQNQRGRAEGYGWEGKGGAYEYAIQLANEAQVDPWVHVPVRANDDYILKLAQLIAYGSDGEMPYTSPQSVPVYPPLEPRRKLYIEYSNELWNWAGDFRQTPDNFNYAQEDVANSIQPLLNYDGETNQYYLASRRVGRRTVEISNIFRSVFGDAQMIDRIRPVLAGHDANLQSMLQPLKYIEDNFSHPVNYYIYGGGGAAYYGPDKSSDTLTLDNIWDDDMFYVPKWSEERVIPNKDLTKAYGIKRIAYEGGPALDNRGHSEDIKEAAWHDPRMTNEMLEHHEVWDHNGGDLFVYYYLAHDYQWGFTYDINDLDTPKMHALEQISTTPRAPITHGTLIPATMEGNAFSIANPTWKLPSTGSVSLTDSEWVSYTVHTEQEGAYTFDMDFSNGSGTVQFLIDGVPVGSETLSGSGVSRENSAYFTPGLHSFRVKATGSFRIDQINVAYTETAEPPNGNPSGLTALGISESQISLSWTDGSTNEAGFSIERRAGANLFIEVATIEGNSTTYTDTSLTPETTYDYRLRAYNSHGASSYSNTASATTLAARAGAPELTEVTPVQTPTSDHTPDYTFSTTEGGSVIVGGTCDVANLYSIPAGTHTITLDYLPDGIYSDCMITMYDTYNNYSDPLPVSAFTIDSVFAPSSLVAHWGFDEASGTTALDSIGNHNGTLTGATWKTGKIGNALSFGNVSSNNYVEVPSSPDITFGGGSDFSISFWINPENLDDKSQQVVDKQGRDGGYSCYIQNAIDRIRCSVKDTARNEVLVRATPYTLAADTWQHVVFTVEYGNVASLYIDGDLIHTVDVSIIGDIANADENLYIGDGAWDRGTSSRGVNGLLDDVCLFNTALAKEEVDRIYNNGIGASCTMLLPLPTPSLLFSALPDLISEGESSALSWSSENSDSCMASDSWSGAKSTTGTENVTPGLDSTYMLTCAGQGGSTSESVSVIVMSSLPDSDGDGVLDIADSAPTDPSNSGRIVELEKGGGMDESKRGYGYGNDGYYSVLAATFEGDGSDVLLHVRGFDIDYIGEVGLFLNGAFLGYLSKGSNFEVTVDSVWWLPSSIQQAGKNRLEFHQENGGWTWGVTRLGIYSPEASFGNINKAPDADDRAHQQGFELHIPGAQSRLLELSGWDNDENEEIELILNGEVIGSIPKGKNDEWTPPYQLYFPKEQIQAGDNIVFIHNRISDGYNWGIRLNALREGAAELGRITRERTTHINGEIYLFSVDDEERKLVFDFFDVDDSDEVQILIDEQDVGFAPVQEIDRSWVTGPLLYIETTGINRLTPVEINNTYNPPGRAYWGARVNSYGH